MFYILEGEKVAPCPDIRAWGEWMGKSEERLLWRTETADALVSTVFLGSDHRYTGGGPPIVFETMVFGGEFDQAMERYATYAEAQAGHERWVTQVFGGQV
jgi:hypothetical protein